MKTILTYPIPLNLWPHYADQVKRFTVTFRQFEPGADYELRASYHWGELTDRIRRMFYGIKTCFWPYNEDGCDIGSAQVVACHSPKEFIVAFPTHAFFHRGGWLKRLMEARKFYGPGLFGASASFEEAPHVRTAGYGLDADIWHAYPHLITSREECSQFERGPKSITEFVSGHGMPAVQVTWDGFQELDSWREPLGIFRRGEQNAMLWWDRHTQIYSEADPDHKKVLEDLADGKTLAVTAAKE